MRETRVTEGMIAASDLDMMTIVDTSDAVVNAIFDFYDARGFAQTASERDRCFIYRICVRLRGCR